ncbi:MAG: ABC transporter permease [Lachnospiraceae bacterium]|nr:ABC transporter permease [Lachnospiraceae bacterium]
MKGGSFFALYIRECKKVLCSLTFLLYAAAVFAMFYTQFYLEVNGPEIEPKPGESGYGMVAREVPEILMPRATENLLWEYRSNSYVAYPIGFYKEVRLKEKDRQKMADIICEITGMTQEELNRFEGKEENDLDKSDKTSFEVGGENGIREIDNNSFVVDGTGNMGDEDPSLPEYHISESMTYERFRELMRAADDLIGGGSRYSDKYIVTNFSNVPKTYEEARKEYEQLTKEDKVTGSYARLYCDYIGVMLGILPVFVAVSLMQLDRKARMEALIYSRCASSARIIFARYMALVSVMFLPIIITAGIGQARVMGFYQGMDMDLFAFAKEALIWMLPSLMAVTAIGMVITEFASGLVAILLQGAWWFVSLFSGGLSGEIGKFSLIIRHNSLYKRDILMSLYGNFLFNRVFFTLLAVLLVMLTAVIYEEKRRGRNIGIRFFVKNRKNQPAA